MAPAKPVVCAALALVLASGAWARGASHGSSAHRSYHHHPHGHTRVFFGGFFFGAPFWRPYYYYGPDFAARSQPPQVYVERFDGQPTPGTQGEIFCPDEGKYYPAVMECPGGWQRVIRPEG